MKMVVERKHHPGKIWLSTPLIDEPCEAPLVFF